MSDRHELDEDEIDLFGLLQTLWAQWKTIVGVTFGAAVLSGVGWAVLKPYETEAYLIDRVVDSAPADDLSNKQPREGALDLVTWRALKPKLIAGAQGMLEAKPAVAFVTELTFKSLATEKGVDQVLVPLYAADKATAKAFGDLKGVSPADILSVLVKGAGSDANEAIAVANERAEFLKAFVIQHRVVDWVNRLEASSAVDRSRHMQTIAAQRIVLRALEERLSQLKQRRDARAENFKLDLTQVLDPKSENAKFLPAPVQIAGVETDMLMARTRLRDAQEQLQAIELRESLQQFASQSLQGGRVNVDALLTQARRLGEAVPPDQLMAAQEAQRLIGELVALRNIDRNGLAIQSAGKPVRGRLGLTITMGALAGGFLSVVFVLVLSAWRKRQNSLVLA